MTAMGRARDFASFLRVEEYGAVPAAFALPILAAITNTVLCTN